MNLWEQQSTYNPNMPLRGLMYFGKLYDKYVADTCLDIYHKKQVYIPTPRYVVSYNGTEERPAVEKLRLSDAFVHEDKSGDFEWAATVINLNHPDISSDLKACKVLADYISFVKKIQEYKQSVSLLDAINKAIDECIQEGILKEILLQHKAEVFMIALTTFNQELHEKNLKEDAREEGREEGREEALCAVVSMLFSFTNDINCIYDTVRKNEIYKEVTKEQIEDIVKKK
ncbi:MAG: hypothetical protein J6K15_15445 [Lachnospiraceae bacterium]|nr:hypothetical protein [Lachnospiraceae bacterium]